jgi:LPXTG-motif cell wall-anchored protein
MKKKIELSLPICIALYLIVATFSPTFAESTYSPPPIDLRLYHDETITKNGRQFHEGAWEEHDGRHLLVLVANKIQLSPNAELHSGTPLLVSFDSHDKILLHLNDTHDLGNGELVLCIDTDDALDLDLDKIYDITIDFYNDDRSTIIYTSQINNVRANDVAISPQTGDNAMGFIFVAVASLILMAFILAPKKRRV